MSWELAGRGAWAQWIDRNAVNGWIARCAQLLTALPPNEADMAVWPAQSQWVRDAYRAIDGVALSIDMPLTSFRPFAEAIRERDTGPDLGTGTWRVDTNRIITGPDASQGVSREDYGYLDLYHRVFLDVDGRFHDDIAAGAPPDSLLDDVDGQGNNCHGDHTTGWTCMSWIYDELPLRTDVAAIVPLRWHYELALSALRRIVGFRTLGDLVEDSRQYIIDVNLATLRALQESNPGALDEADIIDAAADVERAHWRGDDGADMVAQSGQRIASGLGPEAKAIVGALTAIPALLLAAFGRAVQHPRDLWLRTLPLVETAALTGMLEPPTAPTHTPPPPPAVPTLTLYLPPVSLEQIRQFEKPRVTFLNDTSPPSSSSGTAVMLLVGAGLLLMGRKRR
jgi:MYXO-CTERM domain-containing protein